MIASSFLSGLAISAGLIIAIGAQNTYVLRMGIKKQYVFMVALLCALIDSILITLGISGVGALITSSPYVMAAVKWGGIIFLFLYGLRSFKSALSKKSLSLDEMLEKPKRRVVIMTLLALTLLNPHVYLDTFVLVGSIGSQFPQGEERDWFTIGAISASFLWFFSLVFLAGYLAPLFRKNIAWKILDTFTGLLMFAIAISLL